MKLKGVNVPYTRDEINKILCLKAVLGRYVDVFNLYGILFVGESQPRCKKCIFNDTCDNLDGTWEATNLSYAENSLPIKLEDFANCQNEAEVKAVFRKVLKRAVATELFKAAPGAP